MLLYGIRQIFPATTGEWIRGDDEFIDLVEHFEVFEPDLKITVRAYNECEFYEHEFVVRVTTVPRFVAMPYLVTAMLIDVIRNFLARLVRGKK